MSNVVQRWITDTFFGGRLLNVEKQPDGSFWYGMNGNTVDLPYKTLFAIYRNIPHVRSIVNKHVAFFSNARFKIQKRNTAPGEEPEIDTTHPLNQVLDDPNFMQSWRNMLAMVDLTRSVGGVAFLYPGFGASNKARNLAFLKPIEYETYNIEENQSESALTANDLDEIIRYYEFYLENGKAYRYKPSELMIFKDNFYSYTKNLSRITTGMLYINNIYKGMINRGILMDAHGGIGLIAGNQKDGGVSVPMKKSEKKSMLANLNEYGLGANKKPVILTDQNLRYTPMVFPTADLMLFEEDEADFNGLCDLFEMPRELFVGDAAYASTRDAAEADCYNNTIMPAWVDFFKLLNKRLNTRAEGIEVVLCVDHIGCLQEDEGKNIDNQSKKAEMLRADLAIGAIDLPMYQQMMGYIVKDYKVTQDDNTGKA